MGTFNSGPSREANVPFPTPGAPRNTIFLKLMMMKPERGNNRGGLREGNKATQNDDQENKEAEADCRITLR